MQWNNLFGLERYSITSTRLTITHFFFNSTEDILLYRAGSIRCIATFPLFLFGIYSISIETGYGTVLLKNIPGAHTFCAELADAIDTAALLYRVPALQR